MARRKINLQNLGESSPSENIDDLVRGLGTTDLGFAPTDKTVYEVDLRRIFPDPNQPRFVLPGDLRAQVNEGKMSPREAMEVLVARAGAGDRLATLILGGDDLPMVEDGEDKGLRALAASILEVGLRQPINVYTVSRDDEPGVTFYQVAEGERRYWAHQLLVLQGHREFERIRCVIEPMPDDEDVIRRRQQAENAARQDLSSIARARAIRQIRDRLQIELGTRVPDGSTIKLPSQRELDEAVGREVKAFAGRAIGGRMVRNYLRLLTLSAELQDLAEAAQLTEKQLRPVMQLRSDDDRRAMMLQIIDGKLSGRAAAEIVSVHRTPKKIRQVSGGDVEQRLEQRLYQAAKTVYELVSLGDDVYESVLQRLAERLAGDEVVEGALLSMQKLLNDLLSPDEG